MQGIVLLSHIRCLYGSADLIRGFLALDDLAAAQVRVEPSDCVDFTVTCTGEFGAGSFRTELGPAGTVLAAWSTLVMLKRLTRRITF